MNNHKITVNKRGELIQERINRILVNISSKCKSTNNPKKQHTGQKGTLKSSIVLGVLIPFVGGGGGVIVVGLGAKEPLETLRGGSGSLLKRRLLGLLERGTGLEEVEALVGCEAEEERGGGERRREMERRKIRRWV